jgi:hypothetical protein
LKYLLKVKASTADETNVTTVDDDNNITPTASAAGGGPKAANKYSDEMLSTSAASKQHLGAFVVLDREADETLAGGFLRI